MTRLSLPFENGQIAVPETGRLAVFRADGNGDYGFYPTDRVSAIQGFKPTADRLIARNFAVTSTPDGTYAQSIVHLTRSKAETLGLLAEAMTFTDIGGLVLVDGAKTDGIDSIMKRCKAHFDIIEAVAKSHGKIFWMARPSTLPAVVADWRAAAQPSLKPHGFTTAAGMFSPDKIDTGSDLLAENMTNLRGKIADLGAGWGWLAAQALRQEKIITLDLFEAEDIALSAAKTNVTDARAKFHWQDVQTMTVTPDYDAVICNPPFHQSRAADPAIGIGFITKAAEILKPNGTLWLVANRQLPYETALTDLFAHIKPVQETAHFKVLCATRPLHHRKRRH